MQMLRQRTQASKGNVTKSTPLRKFNATEVQQEIERILETALKGVKYEPASASVLTVSLSDSVKNKVKSMKFPRYKFVTMVTVTSKTSQGLFVGSQCLWNQGTDSSATGVYVNNSLIAVASVFATLYE